MTKFPCIFCWNSLGSHENCSRAYSIGIRESEFTSHEAITNLEYKKSLKAFKQKQEATKDE